MQNQEKHWGRLGISQKYSHKQGPVQSAYKWTIGELSQQCQARRQGVRGGSLEPHFWPPEDFIYTA